MCGVPPDPRHYWHMTALRSRRLEALLGAGLDAARYEHFHSLVQAQVSESFDLEFKREHYGSADRDKLALAGDVAALANSAGGIIVLGIEEDAHARAVAAPGVTISDGEIRRVHQIVADRVAPVPVLEVLPAPDPADPGRGFLVIAVPRSPRAPHAVLVNEGLRFPVRNGTTTRYLSEPEVATAYRERFARAHDQSERAARIEAKAPWRLARAEDHCWLLVTLVPDMPGDLMIGYAAVEAAQREYVSTFPMIMRATFSWYRADVAPNYLMLSGSPDSPGGSKWLAADLHSDGSGIFAVNAIDIAGRGQSEDPGAPAGDLWVHDEEIVNGILSGLRFLARHARDHAGAGGEALIRAQVHEPGDGRTIRLSGRRDNPFTEGMGRPLPIPAGVAQGAAPLDALADGGPGLVAASCMLATGLFQQFGMPEALQVTRDGQIRRRYWGRHRHQEIQAWADQARIDIVDQTLPG
jgi:hypothetical protein